MAFKIIGSLNPHGGPLQRTYRLDDSITGIGAEDYVGVTEGAAEGWLTFYPEGEACLGTLLSIVTEDGVGMKDDGAGANFIGVYDTAATNISVEKIAGVVDISKLTLVSVDPDAALATTTGSGKLGYRTDVNTVTEATKTSDENTAVTGANVATFSIHGTDPADSGNHVLSVFEHTIFGTVAS